MPKIKIERSARLNKEDKRGKQFDIVSGAEKSDRVWMDAMPD